AKGGATGSKAAGVIELGVDTLPPLTADPGDRNRTSPFAFTGNRFEYRAPGSNQSISDPMVAINTILADSIDVIAADLEKLLADGLDLADAVQKVLQEIVNSHGAVIFNGNGYSDEWQEEAAARGLKNLRTTVDAVTEYTSPEVIEIFEKYGVLSARELEAREDVIFEYYALTLLVEAKETAEIAKTMIMPAAIRYQGELAGTAASLKMAGIDAPTPLLEELTGLIGALHEGLATLDAGIAGMHGESTLDESTYALETLIPAMATVREVADTLESIVADDLWPLPTYNEMLTIL
ncbi:glutamine synthetase type III, partial [Gordonia terrae]